MWLLFFIGKTLFDGVAASSVAFKIATFDTFQVASWPKNPRRYPLCRERITSKEHGEKKITVIDHHIAAVSRLRRVKSTLPPQRTTTGKCLS
jgi:hypothetical protein